MNTNNNGCKINDDKSDNNNNHDIANNISITSITNTAATSKIIKSITNVSDLKSAEMAVAATPVSLTSITTARKLTSTVMVAAKTSVIIASTMTTKETALIEHHELRKQKVSEKKSAFIIGDSMIKKIDGYLLTSSVNHKYIVKVRPFLSAKTVDMVDYIKPTQRDFNPDVAHYMLKLRIYLPTNPPDKFL